jgi:hypothetical protein
MTHQTLPTFAEELPCGGEGRERSFEEGVHGADVFGVVDEFILEVPQGVRHDLSRAERPG